MVRTFFLLGILALISMQSFAADAPGLEGTWKLAKPQTSLSPAVGGAIPFTASGKEQYEANKAAAAKGDYTFDHTTTRCSSPGLPRLMLTPDRFRIFQRDTIVTFMFEWNRLARQILLPGNIATARKGLGGTEDIDIGTMKGLTRGRWEGKTLIAESEHFADGKLLDNLIVTSDQLKLTERFRLIDRNTLEDRITIEDPASFTRNWDAVLTYKRLPDEAFPEDICLERRDAGSPPLPH